MKYRDDEQAVPVEADPVPDFRDSPEEKDRRASLSAEELRREDEAIACESVARHAAIRDAFNQQVQVARAVERDAFNQQVQAERDVQHQELRRILSRHAPVVTRPLPQRTVQREPRRVARRRRVRSHGPPGRPSSDDPDPDPVAPLGGRP